MLFVFHENRGFVTKDQKNMIFFFEYSNKKCRKQLFILNIKKWDASSDNEQIKKNIIKIGNQLSCLYLAIEQNNNKKIYMDLSSKAEHNSILLR